MEEQFQWKFRPYSEMIVTFDTDSTGYWQFLCLTTPAASWEFIHVLPTMPGMVGASFMLGASALSVYGSETLSLWKITQKPCIMARVCNSNTWEAEARG